MGGNVENLVIRRLEGPFTVAYGAYNNGYKATLLEFDLVGLGSSKATALRELQELFEEYVEEVVNTSGKVEFFHPADREEWNLPDREYFTATVIIRPKNKPRRRPSPHISFRDLRKSRRDFESIQLQPTA